MKEVGIDEVVDRAFAVLSVVCGGAEAALKLEQIRLLLAMGGFDAWTSQCYGPSCGHRGVDLDVKLDPWIR